MLECLVSPLAIVSAAALFALSTVAVADAQENSVQQQRPTAAQSSPSPELLKVPITGIIPGAVKVNPDINHPDLSDAATIERGHKLFIAMNCIGCHADNGGGGMGPALSNRAFIYGSKPANIYLTIRQGRPNGMPSWGASLPSQTIWDLVAYVKSISKDPASGWGTTISSKSPKLEQVPAEFQNTPTPWQYTESFSDGQSPESRK